MPRLCLAVLCAVLLGTGACSRPFAASADASQPGTGGLGSGGTFVPPGTGGDTGSGLGGRGGTVMGGTGAAGAGGTGGNGGTESPDAAADRPTDAPAGESDSPIVPPDARPGEDLDTGAGEGGSSGTGGIGGSAATGGAGGSTSAGGAGGAATTGTKNPPKKFVGNLDTNGEARSDFLKYWDQLTPSTLGKLGAVSASYMKYDWSKLDPLYDFTRKNHIPFHEVALIWESSSPSPITGGLEEQRAGVEDWIRSFCTRYPDTELIDVVYEPLHFPAPTYQEALGGAGASGYDWIVQVFQWARTHCPNSTLLLTDYNTIEYRTESEAFIELVNTLLAAGTPIDAVGAEAVDAARVSTSTVKAYLGKLAAVGLPIYITGYQIGEADDTKQAAIMQEQFPLFWTDDRIHGITFWGYVEGATWRRDIWLVGTDGTPRPALSWLMSYLGR
jgi:endo-1,4-beta-xylanase